MAFQLKASWPNITSSPGKLHPSSQQISSVLYSFLLWGHHTSEVLYFSRIPCWSAQRSLIACSSIWLYNKFEPSKHTSFKAIIFRQPPLQNEMKSIHLCWLGHVLIARLVKTSTTLVLSEHMNRIQEAMGVCLKSQKSNCKLPSLAFSPWVLKSTRTYQSIVIDLMTPWYLKSYCNIAINIVVVVGIIIIHTIVG